MLPLQSPLSSKIPPKHISLLRHFARKKLPVWSWPETRTFGQNVVIRWATCFQNYQNVIMKISYYISSSEFWLIAGVKMINSKYVTSVYTHNACHYGYLCVSVSFNIGDASLLASIKEGKQLGMGGHGHEYTWSCWYDMYVSRIISWIFDEQN